MKLIDRTGQRYGRLVAIEKSDVPRMWRCLCDCGVVLLVTGSNLTKGSTKSCGCLAKEWARHLGANREFIAKRSKAMVKHGGKRGSGPSPEYRTWLAMKSRCYRQSDSADSEKRRRLPGEVPGLWPAAHPKGDP